MIQKDVKDSLRARDMSAKQSEGHKSRKSPSPLLPGKEKIMKNIHCRPGTGRSDEKAPGRGRSARDDAGGRLLACRLSEN
jgi:hypothetical protein